MSDLAVRATRLSKQYRLGGQREWYRSLRETLASAALSPLRRPPNGSTREAPPTIWALRDVSFEVAHGEVVGVIGRNGAGKSTLLKILSRITEPTAGRAEVHGLVGALLEVGTGFHPELTGRENVYLNGAILGMSKADIDRRFDEIVQFAELEPFLDTPVKRYSSGMYTRLAFSVAAHLEPEILVVDEVLSVGDAAFQKKCLGKMEDISREGRTVLFVSHNMPAITRLCTRALLLEAGRVVRDGPPAEVVAAYLQGVLEGPESVTWQDLASAPGTDELRLLSVSVVDRRGSPVVVASVEDELRVRLGYRVYTPGLRFRCAVLLHTQGTCAFTTIEPVEQERPRPGSYVSEVTLPSHLLAEGEYSVSVSIFASRAVKHHYVKARNLLSFQVFDPMSGESARGDYAEGFDGVVRPKLRWQTCYQG